MITSLINNVIVSNINDIKYLSKKIFSIISNTYDIKFYYNIKMFNKDKNEILLLWLKYIMNSLTTLFVKQFVKFKNVTNKWC